MIRSTQLRIKEKTYEKIRKIAEEKERSINKQINFIVEQYINDYEKINGKIEIEEKKNE